MISLKYGIILGAILIIGIYFAYQGSILKEGLFNHEDEKLSYIRGGGFTDKAGVHHKADGWVQSWSDERGAQVGFSPDGDWEKANSQIQSAPSFGPPDTAIITADDSNKEESGYGRCQMYINTEFTDHAPADPPQPVSDPAGGIDSPAFAWANLPTTGWKVATAANSSNGGGQWGMKGLCPNIDPTPPTLEAGKTCSTFDCKAAGQTPNPNIDNVNSYCNENTCTAEQCCLAPALVCSSSMCNPQTQQVKGTNVPCNRVTDIIVSGNASFQINENIQSINGTYKFCPAESGKCLSNSYHHQWIMTPPSSTPAAALGLYGIIGPGCQGACTWYLQWVAAGGTPGNTNNWQNPITCPGQHQSKCDQPVASWTCPKIDGGGLCNSLNLSPDVVGANPTPEQLKIPTGTWIPDTGGKTIAGKSWNQSAPPGIGNPIVSLKTACTADECCIPKIICASHQCSGEWEDNPEMDTQTCKKGGCTDKYCCKKKKICSSLQCENTHGYKQNLGQNATDCDDDLCSLEQCCSKMTCDEMESNNQFSCNYNYYLDPKKKNTACGPDCNNTNCCIADLQCKSFEGQCIGKRHVDDKDKYCPDEGCSDSWCCIDNPHCKDGGYSCPTNSYTPYKDKQCLNAPCTPNDCCAADPTCGTYSGCDTSVEHVGDMSRPCQNGSCTKEICCLANDQCGSFVGSCDAGKHVPEERKKLPCDNNSCSDEQCCIQNPKCGQFDDRLYTCLTGEYIPNPDKTCPGQNCTRDDCCAADPTCSSYNCSSPLQHIADSSISCPNGECSDAICCEDNIRCSSFTCPTGEHSIAGVPSASEAVAAGGGTDDDDEDGPTRQARKGGEGSTGARCLNNICTADQCCMNNQRCVTYACDTRYTTPINLSQLCSQRECTDEECCEPHPKCSGFSCGLGYTMKSNSDDITCASLTCTKKDCCMQNQTCSSYNCKAGQSKRKGKGSCNKIKCTNEECCVDNPRCSSYTCESSYYKTRTLVQDADNVICNGLECTESECCDISSSGKLPKINVWPLYDNSS